MSDRDAFALRDASQVAFGLCVLAILAMPFAIIAGAVIAALVVPGSVPHPVWQKYLFAIASVLWCGAMAMALRHYRRQTRAWTEERRGGNMLLIVECVGAFAGHFGHLVPGWISSDLAATRMYVGAFVILLILCHAATYAILRYRPRLKEILVWCGIAAAAAVEFSRSL